MVWTRRSGPRLVSFDTSPFLSDFCMKNHLLTRSFMVCCVHPGLAGTYGFGIPRVSGFTVAAPSSQRVQAKLDSRASNTAFDSDPVFPDSR